MSEKTAQSLSFENAYARLETILEELNSDQLSLDKSLTLYEEADQLITLCTKQLSDAEQKIQMLIKNREGQILINDANQPKLEAFSPQSSYDRPS